jgi:hypothetical protein
MVDSKFPTVPKVDIANPANDFPDYAKNWQQNTDNRYKPEMAYQKENPYDYRAPSLRGNSLWEQKAAEEKAKSSGIPTSAPAAGTVTPGSSAFVSDAFRNKPEMINAQPPKIGSNPPAAKPASTPSIRPGGK